MQKNIKKVAGMVLCAIPQLSQLSHSKSCNLNNFPSLDMKRTYIFTMLFELFLFSFGQLIECFTNFDLNLFFHLPFSTHIGRFIIFLN